MLFEPTPTQLAVPHLSAAFPTLTDEQFRGARVSRRLTDDGGEVLVLDMLLDPGPWRSFAITATFGPDGDYLTETVELDHAEHGAHTIGVEIMHTELTAATMVASLVRMLPAPERLAPMLVGPRQDGAALLAAAASDGGTYTYEVAALRDEDAP